MVTEFCMPSLGADMDDGVITEWRVEPGDEVRRGQIVVVVETDKSDIEVEVFDDAVVEELLVAEGERVAVGTPIALFGALGAPPDRSAPTTPPESSEADDATPPVGIRIEPAELVDTVEERHDAQAGPGVMSPLVRQLAAALEVDLAEVEASGPGRRVHRDDVLRAAARAGTTRPRVTPRARRLAATSGVDLADLDVGGGVVTGADVIDAAPPERTSRPDVDPARRAIASLMARSWAEIPHFHVASRVDLSAALERLQAVNAERPVTERIIPAALLLHAATRAAVQVPTVNGWWRDGRAELHDHVDLGVVISRRGGGIVAPTIPRAEMLNVDEMMSQLAGLVARARAGTLRSSDVGEASLTVTNLGDLGADLVHGVIHPPQLALVGLGAVRDEVVAIDGLVGVRSVVHATLAGDHRGLDGLVGASFLARFAAAVHESAASIPARQET